MRDFTARMMLILVVLHLPLVVGAVEMSNRYRSPRNPERKVRQSTDFIVLHTTEAPARSSLNKLSDRGEAHFCVTEEGQIYRIVDRDREAFHAGRSMWNGREDVDKFSIGIECVGYHNKPMPTVQIAAIRDLVKELKAMYNIPDERVVCHSHVAYGAPNKWQRHRHRGRKRCGMLFAMPSVRRMLELKSRPGFDPDTRAHRLTVGDDYLKTVLYGNVDTMTASYGKGSVAPASPNKSGSWLSRFIGGKPESAPAAKTDRPQVAAAKARPKPAAKPAKAVGKSIQSIDDLKRNGYVQVGSISKANTASKLAGKKWNSSDTYYTIRGKLTPGNRINAAHMEVGMGVWLRK